MKSMKMMKKAQQGLTLIELMIVVAIIGILAAVTIPAYKDYTLRAKATEVVLAASACRTSVTEAFQVLLVLPKENKWGCEINVGGEEGKAAGTAASKYVESISVSAKGVISVKATDAFNDDRINGKTLTLVPLQEVAADGTGTPAEEVGDAVVAWRCGSTADGTDITLNLLPASCRG